jgi:hypothetical protein
MGKRLFQKVGCDVALPVYSCLPCPTTVPRVPRIWLRCVVVNVCVDVNKPGFSVFVFLPSVSSLLFVVV